LRIELVSDLEFIVKSDPIRSGSTRQNQSRSHSQSEELVGGVSASEMDKYFIKFINIPLL